MIIHEAIYDLSALARYNLHIHTAFSSCAKAEMNMKSILEHAKKSDIQVIAITDHYNSRDCNILENNNMLRQEAAEYDSSIKVLYGAELSAYGIGRVLEPIEVNRALDYRLYSYNHYHLDFWEHPADRSPRGYVNHGLEVLRQLIPFGLADCIAHPFFGRFINISEDKTLITKEMSDKELGDILELGRDHGVAWEINLGAILGDTEFARRYWNIGKEIGVIFHFGTDAHRLASIDTREALELLKPILD